MMSLDDRQLTEIALAEYNRELAKRRMIRFAEWMKDDWITALHHEMIADKLDAVARGEIKRLVISMPPRHGKSELSSVLFPAWWLAANPTKQIIHISYASGLSNEFSRKVRTIVRDDLRYKDIFPYVGLDDERSRIDDWKLVGGGGFKSIGTGGGITGHGADLMIIDDPVKEGDERSLITLQQTYDWYLSAARTRLHPGAAVVIIMTRWHPLDLVGRLLSLAEEDSNADQWETLVLPGLALENDPLGRKPGEALWPERFSVRDMRALQALNARYFDALYQQQPRSEEDQLFRAEDFVRGELLSGPGAWCFDLALGQRDEGDYSAFGRFVYNRETGQMFVSLMRRKRATWPQMRKLIIRLAEAFPEDTFVFPRHNLELMALQTLRLDLAKAGNAGRLVDVAQKGDKRERAQVFADLVANRRVVIAPGKHGDLFIREHAEFPGAYDDQVDVSSVAAEYFGLAVEFTARIRKIAERGPDEELRMLHGLV